NKYKLVRKVERNSKSPARQQPEQAQFSIPGPREDRIRPSSILRKRSSSTLAASAAAVKRATKLVRAKRSTSREELDDTKKHTDVDKPMSTERGNLSHDKQRMMTMTSPPKLRAATYAAESLTATRDQAVILRSLLALVGRHCPAEYDKYVLLEERDKLLSRLREVSVFGSNVCLDKCC
ncbi:unnamed protein product, partial [Strongylus vulgaris]